MVMKRIPQSLFLALFVFAISSFAQTQPRQTAPEELWKEFSSTAGRFTVTLPGNPTETSKKLEYRFREFERHTFTLGAGFATFFVSYSDIPVTLAEPDAVEEFLDHHMHEGEVASSQGKLLSKTEIELDAYPGRELIMETPNSMFRMKYYLVEQRFYQIAISTPKDPAKNAAETARSMELAASKFLDSFKITDTPFFAVDKTGGAVKFKKVIAVDETGKAVEVIKIDAGSALKRVTPVYPPEAKEAGVSGKVEVQVIISEEGQVIEAIAIRGPELLREVSVQAAKGWEFKPTKAGGVPVKVQGIVTFNFVLQ
jgi:TonB family protein